MKTLGLIGGMSWESTALYYAVINRETRRRLGGNHSAKVLIDSCDFAEIEALQHDGAWDEMGQRLARSARRLETAGADVLVLATNTMHCVAPAIEAAATIPLLHIADPTGIAIAATGAKRAGLLGTAFTMEQDFLKERLAARYGIECLIPEADDRAEVHRIIYEELVAGDIRESSRATYRGVCERLAERGAECIILGCTEIGLLLRPGDSALPLHDTADLHARAAVDAALRAE